MPKKITEWFTGIGLPVLECYGLSENVIPMSMNTLKENRIGSVGRPLKPNLIRISSDGEVIVRSPGVFSGYQNSGDEKGLFTEDGFYRTGDFGSFDQDGFLYLSGRQSDLVKSSTGRKLPLIHIETQYRQIPYLEDIVVIGAGRRCIVALLTINPDRLRRLTGESITAAAEVPIDVRKMISADITLAGKHLATHEQIRGFAVLKKPLSTMGGELTNNGKLRRAFVEENHRALIELIYDYLDRKGTTNIGHGDCFFIGT